MDLYGFALVACALEPEEKGNIRINGDFAPELLFDFAEFDGIWCIVGDEVEKACEKERKKVSYGMEHRLK